jgi:dynein heavy chain
MYSLLTLSQKEDLLPTGTRGRAWQGEISFIPKDILDHQTPLQKFDQIHAKYLTSPRGDMDTSGNQKIIHTNMKDSIIKEQQKIEKMIKKEKESFRTTMVNIVM